MRPDLIKMADSIQGACDAESLLRSTLRRDLLRTRLGWSATRWESAVGLADAYAWATYDDVITGATTGHESVVVSAVPLSEDIEKPRVLHLRTIDRIFEGVLANSQVEQILDLPDPQYQDLLRFYRFILELGKGERHTATADIVPYMNLFMRGLGNQEVATHLGVTRWVVRDVVDILRDITRHYGADIIDEVYRLLHESKEPIVIAASPDEIIDPDWDMAQLHFEALAITAGLELDPDRARTARYKLATYAVMAAYDEEIDDAVLSVEPVREE